MRYPTLTAYVERMLGPFFFQVETREELQAREEAALTAITQLFERRMSELRTHEDLKMKTAMAAGTARRKTK